MDDAVHPSRTEACVLTGAEALLVAMKSAGIDCFYANAGTDFTPVVEAYAKLDPNDVPRPVVVTHETAAVAMAHGHYLATGRMQAVMVHVNVGLANAAMGLLNAASDNVPLLMLSGRTPLTEAGRLGSRRSPVQYGQEMYDQSALVAEAVKFRYELRYPEQAPDIIRRAIEIAMSEPRGPVYISLPREPLSEYLPSAGMPSVHAVPAMPPSAPAEAIERAAQLLSAASRPLLVTQRADEAGAAEIVDFAERLGIPVVEPFTVRNVMPSDHPHFAGNDCGPALEAADVVVVADSPVPWLPGVHGTQGEKRVIHIGPDPHFRRLPIRTHAADVVLTGTAGTVLPQLAAAVKPQSAKWEPHVASLVASARDRRAVLRQSAAEDKRNPMSANRLSHCLSEVVDDDTLIFNELGLNPELLNLTRSNQLFTIPHSGGLGWGVPSALGACLADPRKFCIACIGDGSFIFANPVACLQAAEALSLAILIVIDNNATWDAVRVATLGSYPKGASAVANRMPLVTLDPSPDFAKVAEASRCYGRRVTTAEELPDALREAVRVVREEKRTAVLDVATRVADI